jgi:hypothetical protein
MSILSGNAFDKIHDQFSSQFELGEKLPNNVFTPVKNRKFVIREWGDLHRYEVFSSLSERYEDETVYSMVPEMDVSSLFVQSGRPLIYTLEARSKFLHNWAYTPTTKGPGNNATVSPWMLANLQYYFGSSKKWCSYHERGIFEVDVFYVPEDLIEVQVLGLARWTFNDFLEATSLHDKKISDEDSKVFSNYFA